MALAQLQAQLDPAEPLDNRKHEEFAFRYALIGNAKQAYVDVYHCTEDTGYCNGSRLLGNIDIRRRIDFIQGTQSDLAFATMTRNLTAQKPIVHSPDAVITFVDDPTAQIAAATGILKANGRINDGGRSTENIQNNYVMVNVSQAEGIASVADKIMEMNGKLASRRKSNNIIDAQITQENLT